MEYAKVPNYHIPLFVGRCCRYIVDCADLTALLTPQSRVLPEKLTDLRLVKKFPYLLETRI